MRQLDTLVSNFGRYTAQVSKVKFICIYLPDCYSDFNATDHHKIPPEKLDTFSRVNFFTLFTIIAVK